MKNRTGFTLVELSIVLVIIGLLIGGILVGQSLIESAKMQSFVRQIQQFDSLTATFKSKYDNLPGDAATFACASGVNNTCGNGAIEATVASGTFYFFLESSFFWKNLSDAGFRPEGVSFTQTLTGNIIRANINVPKAEIGTDAGVVAYGTTATGNSFYVGGYTANFGGFNTAAGLSAVDSVAYDQKVDDGVANAGNVQVALQTPSASCNSAGAYAIDSGTTVVCNLAIKMLNGMNF